MSSRHPATVRASLGELARRGGLSGPHRDGWGVAYYEGAGARLVKEPLAAADSALVHALQDAPFASTLVVGHIRKATQGARSLANTQPFARELGAATHVFAHNGDLAGPALRARLAVGAFRPLGETDSEYAFCALLEQLRVAWEAARGQPPPLARRIDLVARYAAALRPLGPANFVYADGDAVFAHGHRRMHADGAIRAPGLHVLCRTCTREEPAPVGGDSRQHVVLFASVPLTDERGWRMLEEGELVVARRGTIVERRAVPATAPEAA